jgi:hypothetical protein
MIAHHGNVLVAQSPLKERLHLFGAKGEPSLGQRGRPQNPWGGHENGSIPPIKISNGVREEPGHVQQKRNGD